MRRHDLLGSPSRLRRCVFAGAFVGWGSLIRRAGSTGWRAAIAIIRFALAVLAFLIATGACLVLFVKWNARYERFRVRGLLLALIAFLVVLGLPLLLALRYPY